MLNVKRIKTDVLVMGAGAAGLSAAIAAAEKGAKVTVLTKGRIGKAGATFVNVSKALGMQVGFTGDEKAFFYLDVAKAGQDVHDAKLAMILVSEAEARFNWLKELGVRFREDREGLVRLRGCFSEHKRAVAIDDLGQLCSVLKARAASLGVKFIEEASVATFLRNYDFGYVDVAGVLAKKSGGEFVLACAKAYVVASGGGGGLFKHTMMPRSQNGVPLWLSIRSRADAGNLEFVQWMITAGRKFFPLEMLKDYVPHIAGKPFKDKELLEKRMMHYPFSTIDETHLFDAAIFKACKEKWQKEDDKEEKAAESKSAKKTGKPGPKRRGEGIPVIMRSRKGDKELVIEDVKMSAHSFNGGLHIDERAKTSVANLYACGEVTTGMHGANRIGGAMLTNCFVFGRIAGESAAQHEKASDFATAAEAKAFLERRIDPKSGETKKDIERDYSVLRNTFHENYGIVKDAWSHFASGNTIHGAGMVMGSRDGKSADVVGDIYELDSATRMVGALVKQAQLRKGKTLGPHYFEGDGGEPDDPNDHEIAPGVYVVNI
ncbi:MAG: FAD-dependent oxidoreductase [Planctomycetes bacterium]|nr:FAD-dependent oxidoreductase [Planctomycetota bacterium]